MVSEFPKARQAKKITKVHESMEIQFNTKTYKFEYMLILKPLRFFLNVLLTKSLGYITMYTHLSDLKSIFMLFHLRSWIDNKNEKVLPHLKFKKER